MQRSFAALNASEDFCRRLSNQFGMLRTAPPTRPKAHANRETLSNLWKSDDCDVWKVQNLRLSSVRKFDTCAGLPSFYKPSTVLKY